MRPLRLTGLAAVLALLASAALTAPTREPSMPAPIVFFDIAAPDLARQAAFYRTVFGWDIDATGGFAVPVTSPLRATLRVEPPNLGPVTERVLYVGVPDIDAAIDAIKAHGGAVVFPRTVVPGVVILALFNDPAGNRMGLVELDRVGQAIVPPRAP